MKKMRVFAIKSGCPWPGAKVETFHLTNKEIKIPAILVGEEGRGRARGVLPVQLMPDSYNRWLSGGSVEIKAAQVGTTRSGAPKLFEMAAGQDCDSEAAIVVFRTYIGFRGGNSHTGDCEPDRVPDGSLRFKPFPGRWLVKGHIAQGAAGRMGRGGQGIAVVPRGVVFRTGYSGRLYGNPAAHYYIFDGNEIISATWEERQLLDLFPAVEPAAAADARSQAEEESSDTSDACRPS